MNKRPKTLNRGADDDRAAIKAHLLKVPVLAIIVDRKNDEVWHDAISRDNLLLFIDGMASRADHRKGGRGRKWQAKKKGRKPNRTGNK